MSRGWDLLICLEEVRAGPHGDRPSCYCRRLAHCYSNAKVFTTQRSDRHFRIGGCCGEIHDHRKEGTGNVDPEVIEHRTRPSFRHSRHYKSDLGHRKGICFRFPPGPLEAKVGWPETSAGTLLKAQMSPRAVPARSPTWSATRPAQVLSLVL
jgi:hypothetical protein